MNTMNTMMRMMKQKKRISIISKSLQEKVELYKKTYFNFLEFALINRCTFQVTDGFDGLENMVWEDDGFEK